MFACFSYSGPLASTKYCLVIVLVLFGYMIGYVHDCVIFLFNHWTPSVHYSSLGGKFSGCPISPRWLPTQMVFNTGLLTRMWKGLSDLTQFYLTVVNCEALGTQLLANLIYNVDNDDGCCGALLRSPSPGVCTPSAVCIEFSWFTAAVSQRIALS